MNRLLDELARTTIDERVRAASQRCEVSGSAESRLSVFKRSFAKRRQAAKRFMRRERAYPLHEKPAQ